MLLFFKSIKDEIQWFFECLEIGKTLLVTGQLILEEYNKNFFQKF